MEVLPYYQSGAGGKQLRLRRRHGPARTPYDRPLEGRYSNSSRRSWLSKLVSPIASGAGKLFSSVFQQPEETSSSACSDDSEDDNSSEEEREDNGQGAAVLKDDIVIESDIQDADPTSAAKQRSDSKLSEIENLLNSKTFTRDEYIHLIELLQSRVVDSSGSKEHGQNTSTENFGNYLKNQALDEAHRWQEERRKSQEESGNSRWNSVLCGNVSSLALSADVPDNAASSPVDIAKAYMGVRPTWASSSPLALQSYKSSESGYLKSLSFVPTSKECLSINNSQLEFKYRTPTPSRTWDSTQRVTYNPYSRPALTQTPYSRSAYSQHSIQTDNAVENDTYSRWTQIQHSGTGGREILKRRCSVIDDGVRRMRQKSFGNVSSFSSPYKGFDSSMTNAGSSNPILSSGLEAGLNSTFRKLADVDKSNSVSTTFQIKENVPKICGVPTQSSLIAHKILENSNGMLPLPNKKSADEQLVNAKDKTTYQLTMSVADVISEKSNNVRNASSTPASLDSLGSAFGSPAIPEKNKHSQPNIVEGLENKACESREDAITLDIQTSKSVSVAFDVGLNHNEHPTFEFGSGNTSKGPIFSFATNGAAYSDASKPKFDFKFESKREMLFSAAVEAAVASESSSQSSLSSSPMSTAQSALAASSIGIDSNSKPAFSSWNSASLQSISSSTFSSPLFTGSLPTSFHSTSSSLFSNSVTTSRPSLGPFGFSKLSASASAPVSFTSLTKTSSQAGSSPVFDSCSNTSFGLTRANPFGLGNTQFGASTSPVSAASFGLGATVSPSSGLGSISTVVFGSSTLSTTISSSSFSLNGCAPFKSNITPPLYSSIFKTSSAPSLGLGTHPQFGPGGSVNGESKQAFGLVETVEAVVDKSASQTMSSIGCGLDVKSLTSAGFASSSGPQKPIVELTSSTSAVNTSSMETTLVDVLNNGQMNGKDLKDPSKLTGAPVSGSAEQTSSSTVSRTSAALTIDSQSNAESSEAQPTVPSQKPSMFGVQTSIASVGHKEVADNGGEKRSRKILRIKRDRIRKK